jgi:hypothetical protein
MTLKELKQTKLYGIMKACNYTDEMAEKFARDLEAVMTDDGVRFEPAPKTLDVPMGRRGNEKQRV